MLERESTNGRVITAVERAADVLLLFARAKSKTLGVTEIATELGLSKAVVHRILTSLRGRGFVELQPETRRYALGPSALGLGMSFRENADVRVMARDALVRLVRITNETATVSIRTGWNRVYLDQVTPDREVKMTVQLGKAFPLHAGSSSKAFLAFLPDGEIDAYLSRELDALTDLTITDPEKLREELDDIRQRGYAVSLGERQAYAGSVAAPILDDERNPVAVMSVCGPVERFRSEIPETAAALVKEARSLSARLGHAVTAAD